MKPLATFFLSGTCWILWASAIAWASAPALEPGSGRTTEMAAFTTNLPLKLISPSCFELGKVRFDKKERWVRFPALVNQRTGAIEYVLVTSFGKTHESLLRTDAQPYHIHLALLLLGAQGAGTNSFPNDSAMPLPGSAVTIQLNWKLDGKDEHACVEDFVYNIQTKAVMTKGEWIYNGSRIVDGTFLAQQDGSILSVMVDPEALINNPRPGRENDKIWQVLPERLPGLNWPVEVVIRLK